jgi:hypothetical protein
MVLALMFIVCMHHACWQAQVAKVFAKRTSTARGAEETAASMLAGLVSAVNHNCGGAGKATK